MRNHLHESCFLNFSPSSHALLTHLIRFAIVRMKACETHSQPIAARPIRWATEVYFLLIFNLFSVFEHFI